MDRCCFPLSLASAGGLGPTLVADPGLRLLPPALASGASGLLLGAGGVLRPRVMGVTSILLPAASSSPAEPGARTTGAGVPVSWDSWLVRANDWPNGGPTQTVIVPNCPVWRRTTWGGGGLAGVGGCRVHGPPSVACPSLPLAPCLPPHP